MVKSARKPGRRVRRRGRGWPEKLGVGILLLVVVVFGLSIADRFRPGANERGRVVRLSGLAESLVPDAGSEVQEARMLAALELGDVVMPPAGRPVVSVENGSTARGLGQEMMAWLRENHFDVTDCENADRNDYPRTLVIDRVGRGDAAARVLACIRDAFGVGELRLEVAEVAEVDVRVVIGADLADQWERREAERAVRAAEVK